MALPTARHQPPLDTEAWEGHKLFDHQPLYCVFTITERLIRLGFQAMTMTLQRQASQDANHADGETGQAKAEHARHNQQKPDDEQRHGNQVQRQVGRVLMVLRGLIAPLPGGEDVNSVP